MTDQPPSLDDLVKVAEIQDASGASFRQLDYWWRRGFFQRTGEPKAPGSGYNRGWTRRELTIAVLIVRLKRTGFDVAQAAEWARDAVDSGRTEVVTDFGITITWGDVA